MNRGGLKSLRARDLSTKGTKDAKKRKRLEQKGVNSVLRSRVQLDGKLDTSCTICTSSSWSPASKSVNAL